MKKLILATAALLMCCSVFSQRISIGAKAGLSSSQLTTDYVNTNPKNSQYQYSNSEYLSLFLKVPIAKNVITIIEASYSKKTLNFGTKEDVVGASNSGNIELEYLEFPLLLEFSTGKRLCFFTNFGPSLNILVDGLDCEYSSWNSFIPGQGTSYTKQDIIDDFEKYNICFLSNIGMQFHLTSHICISAGAKLSYDITEVTKGEHSEITESLYTENNNIHFMLEAGLSLQI